MSIKTSSILMTHTNYEMKEYMPKGSLVNNVEILSLENGSCRGNIPIDFTQNFALYKMATTKSASDDCCGNVKNASFWILGFLTLNNLGNYDRTSRKT